MIIEFFGPPGAGKSTFSHRLANDLRQCGFVVKLILSERPAESKGLLGRHGALARRLARPARQIARAALTGRLTAGVALTRQLLAAFPQNATTRALRIGQYLVRLDHTWRRAARTPHVVIFDQAYLQTAYTLAASAGVTDPAAIAAPLKALPRADLVIDVDAPLPVLQNRLRNRLDGQGPVERMLEHYAHPFEGDEQVLDAIRAHLRARGQQIVNLNGDGDGGVGLDAIRAAVTAQCAKGLTSGADSAPSIRAKRRPIWIAASTAFAACPILAALMLVPAITTRAVRPDPNASTSLHFASQGNFDAKGRYMPALAGFDLADASSAAEVDALPDGVKALVWVAMCGGVTPEFVNRVTPFLGKPKVFGFYLMDDPDPWGRWNPQCRPANLAGEVDWIKARAPNTQTFVALMNTGSYAAPSYVGGYTPANSHVDLYGIAAYPCFEGADSCDLGAVQRFVTAALTAGIDRSRIIPVFQAFGHGTWRNEHGRSYAPPSPTQTEAMIRRWAELVPTPVFDYAYSWGSQRDDVSLATSPDLAEVFRRHNTESAPHDGQRHADTADGMTAVAGLASGPDGLR